MVRIALLALIALALDLAWLLAPGPGVQVAWPRRATIGRCAIALHEPRRDPVADDTGAHTLRIAFVCTLADGRPRSVTAPEGRAIRGTAVIIGDPQVDGGAYALSGARVGLLAFPTVLDPDSVEARECRTAIESALSGSTLFDCDPRFRALGAGETMLAGPDSRVYALRGGAWWREETDGSWSRLSAQGSAAARRDPRIAPLERTMTERQLRDGR
jgi:hypothetical protein